MDITFRVPYCSAWRLRLESHDIALEGIHRVVCAYALGGTWRGAPACGPGGARPEVVAPPAAAMAPTASFHGLVMSQGGCDMGAGDSGALMPPDPTRTAAERMCCVASREARAKQPVLPSAQWRLNYAAVHYKRTGRLSASRQGRLPAHGCRFSAAVCTTQHTSPATARAHRRTARPQCCGRGARLAAPGSDGPSGQQLWQARPEAPRWGPRRLRAWRILAGPGGGTRSGSF